ncbi:hypothetical protein [Alteromonas sp. a30]|uniref:hypothetical protein n=1 Tax=Alteromonas sp. a30 TaxID=2730917 RepID=UPI002280D383|nr:hypothetical protein [Alteromonas sp. a30]MCY7295610.1 hypothetical protein [Alteromonas sp. a30]
MIVTVGKNGAILLPQDENFTEENKLEIDDILLCTLTKDKGLIKLEKFSEQPLTNEQIKATTVISGFKL